MVLRWSTREGKRYRSRSFEERHEHSENVEIAAGDAHAPALLEWADCVINFGSSIGIEALLQGKPLIAPSYLHGTVRSTRPRGAALAATTDDEILQQLRQIGGGEWQDSTAQGREALFREIIYGGEGPHDVLESYYGKITASSLAY